jgi:hypothetical protein
MPVVLHPGKTGDASQVVVASYRAPGPPTLARVAHLEARHVGTKLLIRFGDVRGANGYGVSVTLSSGQHEFLRVTRGVLTVLGVFGEIVGKVTVVALGNNTTASTGRAASVRFSRASGD